MTDPATQAAAAMREAAAQKLAFMGACLPDGPAKYQLSHAEVAIRDLPLPEPPPDPRDALIGTDVSDAAIADATIARLSAQLEESDEWMIAVRQACRDAMGGNTTFIDDDVARAIVRLKAERDGLSAQLGAAREALEPFAVEAANFEKCKDDRSVWLALMTNSYFSQMDRRHVLNVAHLRRARAALAKLSEGA